MSLKRHYSEITKRKIANLNVKVLVYFQVLSIFENKKSSDHQKNTSFFDNSFTIYTIGSDQTCPDFQISIRIQNVSHLTKFLQFTEFKSISSNESSQMWQLLNSDVKSGHVLIRQEKLPECRISPVI